MTSSPIKSDFSCSLEEFKVEVSNFFKRLKADLSPTEEQIEQGLKIIGLMYLYIYDLEKERYDGESADILKLVYKSADEFLLRQRLTN